MGESSEKLNNETIRVTKTTDAIVFDLKKSDLESDRALKIMLRNRLDAEISIIDDHLKKLK